MLNAAGSGYAVGDLLTVSGGSGMELQVTALGTNNAVAAFNVVSLGSGYTAANGGATAGGKGTGCTVNVSDTPVSLTVNEVKSVDIATTTGTVIFNATGNVNVGTLGGFNLESVNAGGEARIQAQSGLVDVRGDTNPVIVAGGNAILEGGNNGIGTSSVPIYVALSTGSLSASAANDIYITATEYDLRLVDIYSNANVYLTADGTGSIFDDNPNSAAAGVWEIGGQSAFLQAGGSIGTSSNYVATDLGQSGKVTATAGQNIYLHQVSGNMNVAAADSTNGGNIGLWAAVNLYDANGTVAPVAIGNNITLEADSGVINKASGGVAVGFAIRASGNLTSLSSLNTYVTETTGNLSLNTVQTQAGTAFISAPAGEILNGTGNTNITSGETYLFASGDIGTQANPIKAQTPSGSIAAIVQGASTAGSIYLDNEGALDLSNSVTGSGYGMQAGGGVYVNTDCPLEISSDVFAQGDIVKQAGTSLGETNSDLTVDPGVTIQSANGYVSLIAGTAVILEGSSSQITTIASNASYVSIVAGTNVTVQPDVVIAAGYTGKNSSTNVTIQGDAYTSGSTTYLNLDGVITGTKLTITGGHDNDVINLTNVQAGTPTEIDAGSGNDTIDIGSKATTTNTGGVVSTIADALTINGQGGTNTINIDDSGDTAGPTGTLTSTTLTGLGMPGSITYGTTEYLNINLGAGPDTFTISSTGAVTNLYTGAGSNIVYVTEIDNNTTIYDQSTTDQINVGWVRAILTPTAPQAISTPSSLSRETTAPMCSTSAMRPPRQPIRAISSRPRCSRA